LTEDFAMRRADGEHQFERINKVHPIRIEAATIMKALRVATCQFSVEPDIAHNRRWILKQIDEAGDQGADLVHFSECALSGYAGVDIPQSLGIARFDLSAL
jgi:hypothetical protein